MSGSTRRAIGTVVFALMAPVAGGCGSASSTSASASARATGTAAKPATSRPAAPVIPAGSVAVVAGAPITQATFNHWMYVAAKSQTSQTPGTPAIVPDPPDYKNCIARVRKTLPRFKHKATETLVADCRERFQTLSSQVMGFLIEADWIQADGARQGIVPTDAQVASVYTRTKQQQFPDGKGYQAFLAKTGQTDRDIRVRFRINLILNRLTAREKGSAAAKETTVNKREKRLFAGQTRCTTLVLMADCGNYRTG
ncbi:MAG TPA: hypothetical protein VFH80_21965 [Solirubrobacteraceae bacterium]|nr:hypothetical protein [Solirubrobacteraceae bacterium]